MKASLLFTDHALKDLKSLDKKIAYRILKKLDWFIEQPDPFYFSKKLVNPNCGVYRFRIGDYRVLFDIEEKTGFICILIILRVKHRKEIYDI